MGKNKQPWMDSSNAYTENLNFFKLFSSELLSETLVSRDSFAIITNHLAFVNSFLQLFLYFFTNTSHFLYTLPGVFVCTSIQYTISWGQRLFSPVFSI